MTPPPDRPDAAAVRVPPPGVPLAAVVLAWTLDRIWPIDVGGLAGVAAIDWAGYGTIAVSFLVFGVWPIVLFRRSGQDPNPWRPSPQLIDAGPYRITRNPMYVQMVGICLGLALVLSNAWLLLLTPGVAIVLDRLVIRYEEEYLERRFGARYLAYKDQVGRWL